MISRVHTAKHRPCAVLVTTVFCMLVAGARVPAQEAAAQEEELSEVVVTGSRILRRDYESQSPIVTLQAEAFEERSAVGLETALNQLPQFAPAGTGQAISLDAATPFPSPTAAPGAATVDLRGLGTNRSLVLVDGRRVQPINGNLVVDLNTIPAAAIQSVEVITGGAAAVYGADAISGVVNLILKKNFEGAQLDAQYGITQHGDGEEYQFSALLGSNYADGRGNVQFGANYAKRGVIRSRDRDWVRAGWNDSGTSAGSAGTAGGLSQFECQAPGPFTGPGNCPPPGVFDLELGSTIWNIDQNGSLFDLNDPQNPAHPYTGPLGGESGFKINPDGSLGYNDRSSGRLSLPLERWSIFASTNYDLTDRVELFTEARFSENSVSATGTHVALWNIWSIEVPYNAQYDDPASPDFGQGGPGFAHHPVSAQLAGLLNQRVSLDPGFDPLTAPWQYNGSVDWVPPYRTDTTSNVFQFIAGVRGKLPVKDWSWEVYGSHGKSSVNAHLPESFLSHPKVQQLFDQDQYGRGWINPAIIAAAGLCTSGLPIFNPDGSVNNTPSVSQDCADYVTLRMNNVATIKQQVAEATVQGTLLDLWAGPMQFAAGVDYRSERFQFTPDAAYNANQDDANVVNNIALPLGVNGLTYVREAYAEFAIPLLRDLPLVQRFSIEPGIRFSDYKTGGSLETWKLLGDWQVSNWVRLRGGMQRANRAPNITELFMPVGAASIQGAVDGCGNWPTTPTWANHPDNPNRENLQVLCQYLMTRDGAPPSLYVPTEDSANNYNFTVFGPSANGFPFDLGVQGGNPDLDSEKADTVTVGLVLRSPWQVSALQRLTLSVDWYRIKLTGAIGVPDQPTVYRQCLDAQYNPRVGEAPGSLDGATLAAGNPYCALIQREYTPQFPYAADRRYSAQYVNLGGIKTSGVDVQLDWATDLAGLGLDSMPGSVSANIQYNYLDSFARAPYPGGAFVEERGTTAGGNFNFRSRWLTTLGYRVGGFSAGLRWQHLPGLDPSGNALGVQRLNSHDQFDVFGRWKINARYDLRFGIDNLLDADPEVFGAVRLPGDPEGSNNALGSSTVVHDTFGRRFYVGVRVML